MYGRGRRSKTAAADFICRRLPMITIQGKGVSAGVGVGPLYFYRRATAEIKRYTVEDPDAEWHRFKGA